MNDEARGYAAAAPLTSENAPGSDTVREPAIPDYLHDTYWWAYLHPNAIRFWEREWLVNLILWGNMSRLTDAVLEEVSAREGRSVLQLACVYGRFSDRLAGHLAAGGATLHLLDIATIQLRNARRKLAHHPHVRYHHQDSSALTFPPGAFDSSVLFFLLHEQPEDVRRRTLAEALRVTRPGGKVVIVDYHGPSRANPWRYLMQPVLHWLEPFALDLWRKPVAEFLPAGTDPRRIRTTLFFGGLYQKTVVEVPG